MKNDYFKLIVKMLNVVTEKFIVKIMFNKHLNATTSMFFFQLTREVIIKL